MQHKVQQFQILSILLVSMKCPKVIYIPVITFLCYMLDSILINDILNYIDIYRYIFNTFNFFILFFIVQDIHTWNKFP